jgi:hypothetical protein
VRREELRVNLVTAVERGGVSRRVEAGQNLQERALCHVQKYRCHPVGLA